MENYTLKTDDGSVVFDFDNNILDDSSLSLEQLSNMNKNLDYIFLHKFWNMYEKEQKGLLTNSEKKEYNKTLEKYTNKYQQH